jgi:hypothetical protein
MCSRTKIQPTVRSTPGPKPECGTLDQLDYERCQMLARENLGEDRFAARWADGRALTLEQAIGLVLSTL